MKDTDKNIIKQVNNGDIAAFAQLVSKYQHMAYTLAFGIVKNSQESEEIVQDAFMKVYRGLSGFEFRSAFSTWLYQIVYRTAISVYRGKKNGFVDIDGSDFKQHQHFACEDVESEILTTERNHILANAIDNLDEDDGFLVILYYYKELSIDEIVQITGLTAANVKVKLHRARKQLLTELKTMMKGEMPEFYNFNN